MRCCIPACEAATIRESYAFCVPHWKEYSKQYGTKRAEFPDWLKLLINTNKQEDYAEKRDSRYMRSLETLIEQGKIDLETAVPYCGPPTKGKGVPNVRYGRECAVVQQPEPEQRSA